MHRHALRVAVTAITALAAVLLMATPSSATSGWKWATDDSLGYMGQDVHGSGLTVSWLEAQYVPPNRDFLTGHAWRFHITWYKCDPRGQDRSQAGCPQQTPHWNGPTRTGNPPKAGSTCVTLDINGAGIEACKDYGLAYASTADGDFLPGWGTGNKTFASGSWLCTEIQKRDSTGKWNNIGGNSPIGKGLRACAEVHD